MAEPQPSERDRELHNAAVLRATNRLGGDVRDADFLRQFCIYVAEEMVQALAAARAEGRREAIEECARKVEGILRYSILPAPENVAAAIRALLTEPGAG